MEKRLFVVICLSFLLLFTILFNELIDSLIKILSSLFLIIINFIFYIKFKRCFSEDKNKKELKVKINQKEELKKNGFNIINYQDKIYETINNIKNKFNNLLSIFFKMDDKKDNNFKIYKSKKIKTISPHTGIVEKIILLKDGRLAFAIYHRPISILIYNADNFSIDLKIDNLDNSIEDLMQTKTGNIIASLLRGLILVIKLTSTSYEIIQKFRAHEETVEKTIEIKDGRLISCGGDKKMRIWKNNNNQYIYENILYLEKAMKEKSYIREQGFICCFMRRDYNEFHSIDDILELKNNVIVSISNEDSLIIFWNIKNLEIICQIKNWYIYGLNKLKKLSNNLFIIGGEEYLYLFSSLNYKLINKIEIYSKCVNICCLSDGKILTGHKDGKIRQYNLINNELKLIGEKKCHNGLIKDIIQLKEDSIISCSDDKEVNIYKNKYHFFW